MIVILQRLCVGQFVQHRANQSRQARRNIIFINMEF